MSNLTPPELLGPYQDDKPFVWKKKYSSGSVKPKAVKSSDKIQELELLRKRREERERAREERQREIEAKQREEEARKFQSWDNCEAQFLLKQAKLRSDIRMREGRARPVDKLIYFIEVFRADNGEKSEETFIINPLHCLNGLRLSDILELQEEVSSYKKLDLRENAQYWDDLEQIIADEAKKLEYSNRKDGSRINSAVEEEQKKILAGKTIDQLENLQTAIEKKISSQNETIDISYWENLLLKIKADIARGRLNDLYKVFSSRRKQATAKEETTPDVDKVVEDEHEEIDDTQICINEYEEGRYSPKLLDPGNLEPGVVIVDHKEDHANLERRRKEICSIKSRRNHEFDSLKKTVGPDEQVFSSEEIIEQDASVAKWSDKYRPRKPRYFNRVHTGFEWNKYNQTHYDIDNPPPKIVQGYKFNIFYPDLIDKNQTPTYSVTPCEDKDFAIIRFKAGPPYEDIAFKIVNREWNYSHKSGFRSQFSNNILQLWFHFKRYRYRR